MDNPVYTLTCKMRRGVYIASRCVYRVVHVDGLNPANPPSASPPAIPVPLPRPGFNNTKYAYYISITAHLAQPRSEPYRREKRPQLHANEDKAYPTPHPGSPHPKARGAAASAPVRATSLRLSHAHAQPLEKVHGPLLSGVQHAFARVVHSDLDVCGRAVPQKLAQLTTKKAQRVAQGEAVRTHHTHRRRPGRRRRPLGPFGCAPSDVLQTSSLALQPPEDVTLLP